MTMDRSVFDAVNLGQTTLMAAREDGSITIEGDAAKVDEFIGLIDTFEFWFDIVTP